LTAGACNAPALAASGEDAGLEVVRFTKRSRALPSLTADWATKFMPPVDAPAPVTAPLGDSDLRHRTGAQIMNVRTAISTRRASAAGT
jgi:hypothetical protein